MNHWVAYTYSQNNKYACYFCGVGMKSIEEWKEDVEQSNPMFHRELSKNFILRNFEDEISATKFRDGFLATE